MGCLKMIKFGKENKKFSTGAVRSERDADGNLKGRMDLLPWEAIMLVSKHCQEGAMNPSYGPHNVDKGMPQSSLMDSAMRHGAKYIAGWTDEDHLVAMCWNALFALQQTITHPELIDVPWRQEDDEY